jgi:hypothetical protein
MKINWHECGKRWLWPSSVYNPTHFSVVFHITFQNKHWILNFCFLLKKNHVVSTEYLWETSLKLPLWRQTTMEYNSKTKTKSKVLCTHAMKAYAGRYRLAPLIFTLTLNGEISFWDQLLYSRDRVTCVHCRGAWISRRASPDDLEKSPLAHTSFELGLSVPLSSHCTMLSVQSDTWPQRHIRILQCDKTAWVSAVMEHKKTG